MSAPIPLRRDFDASQLRGFARKTKDGPQARRLLALAANYDGGTHTEAAKLGGVGLQIIRDWVLRFNARGPDGLLDGKSPGQPSKLNDGHRRALARMVESGPIDEYTREFRPTLLRGANAPWLFPGEGGQPKMKLFFSKQITERILKATGLRITVHQFRHAAAAIYLKQRPGDYETVRRLLGHRDIQTTTRFYCGLQTMEATQQFGKLIRENIQLD